MGVLTGNNIRGQAELKHHTPTIKGYWANKNGQKISKTSFGSTVRLYIEEWTEYIRLKPVNVKIYIKSNASGKEAPIADGLVKQLINSLSVETSLYIETKLPSMQEAEFLTADATQGFALACVVSEGFGFLYDNEMIASIEVGKPCFCNRDFTVEELKEIIIQLRKDDKTGDLVAIRDTSDTSKWEMGAYVYDKLGNKLFKERTQYDVIGGCVFMSNNNEKMADNESNIAMLAICLNMYFQVYKISTCIRKLHFIAQAYVETQRFTRTYETSPNKFVSGGDFYRGRGLLHLTHDSNYKKCYVDFYKSEPTVDQFKEFVPKVAKSMKIACQSSCWYWSILNCNKYADDDSIANVSAAINRPASINGSTSKINGYNERVRAYKSLKKIMNYDECINKTQ